MDMDLTMPKRHFTLAQRQARSLRAIEWNRKHRALHVARTLAARAKQKKSVDNP